MNCNGVTNITQQVGGGRCLVPIAGDCGLWHNWDWVGKNCSNNGVTQSWCPEYGYVLWNVPAGELVRGNVYVCAIIGYQQQCNLGFSPEVQF